MHADINFGSNIDLEACTQSYIQLSGGGLTNHHKSVSSWEHQGWCGHPSKINQRDLMQPLSLLFLDFTQSSHVYSLDIVSYSPTRKRAPLLKTNLMGIKFYSGITFGQKLISESIKGSAPAMTDLLRGQLLYNCLKFSYLLAASLFYPLCSLSVS